MRRSTIAGVELAKLLDTMNARIERLLDRDHRIGHAYFLNLTASEDIAQLREVLQTRLFRFYRSTFSTIGTGFVWC